MGKRNAVYAALAGGEVPYTPWNFGFTQEPTEELKRHFGIEDQDALDEAMGNHLMILGNAIGFFEDLGGGMFRDHFGVVWNRTVDKDIGMVEGQVVTDRERLDETPFPDPLDNRFFADIERRVSRYPDRFRAFAIGFSLYERAWSLRGMTELLMDFIDAPEFVAELMDKIADYNIAQAVHAIEKYDVDAVFFGDDWGQQHGLIMGADLWREFIRPRLERMYGAVKSRGKKVIIHSCGDVDELFDDLVEIGLDCFNPFQPEVMDITAIHQNYLGRLSFYGGLSTQKTLPYGSTKDVAEESDQLLEMGLAGNYIFSPAHAVESDVPLENILTFINSAKSQPGYAG